MELLEVNEENEKNKERNERRRWVIIRKLGDNWLSSDKKEGKRRWVMKRSEEKIERVKNEERDKVEILEIGSVVEEGLGSVLEDIEKD